MASLDVVFEIPGGGLVTRTFKTRPIGVEFVREMPMKVTRARSEALELGVEVDWTIVVIGGKAISDLDFREAFRIFKEAVQPLASDVHRTSRPEWMPLPVTVGEMHAMVTCPDWVDNISYLAKYGFQAKDKSTWFTGVPRPDLLLGAIFGHSEKANHTWYVVQGSLAKPGDATTVVKRWHVERRLKHIRELLHDPVKNGLGDVYTTRFAKAPFAHYGAPSGTTHRLENWLTVLASCINDGIVSPRLTALVLRFLEAPELDPTCAPLANAPAPTGEEPAAAAAAVVDAEPTSGDVEGTEEAAAEAAVAEAAEPAAAETAAAESVEEQEPADAGGAESSVDSHAQPKAEKTGADAKSAKGATGGVMEILREDSI